MGSIVSLIQTQSSEAEIQESLAKALDFLEFEPDDPVESVAIKPNLCYYWKADTGYTTDPRIVAGLIDWIRERYGRDVKIQVVEADATAMRTKYAFPILGYEQLAKEKNIQLLNLSNDSIAEKKVNVNGRAIAFKIPQSLLKTDLFISVPKLKTMRATRITCALKNVFGCIASPRKIVYHAFLNEAIVGINKILRPSLTIVDGLVALGHLPVKMDLIMASVDPFSIDWIASQLLRCNPRRIEFLRLAMKEKLGSPVGIQTRGESLATFRNAFPREGFLSSRRWWSLQFWLLKSYSRIVDDIIPPILEGLQG